MVCRALILAVSLSLLPAQEQGVSDGVAEGTALLQRLAKAHAEVAHITASYVQRRTTKLVKKPLESSGAMAFRREPGCVVFRVAAPRVAVIRLDTRHYEVYRPEQARLERFVLPSDEMPRLLFDALALTETKLKERFAIAGSEPVADRAGVRRVRLVPTDKKTRGVAAQVSLYIDAATGRLCGFGYTDPRGDVVEVELSDVQTPKEPAAETFELKVPEGTRVIEQKIPEPAASEGATADPKQTLPSTGK